MESLPTSPSARESAASPPVGKSCGPFQRPGSTTIMTACWIFSWPIISTGLLRTRASAARQASASHALLPFTKARRIFYTIITETGGLLCSPLPHRGPVFLQRRVLPVRYLLSQFSDERLGRGDLRF